MNQIIRIALGGLIAAIVLWYILFRFFPPQQPIIHELQGIREIQEREAKEAQKQREGYKAKEAQQLKEQEEGQEAQKRQVQDEQKRKKQEEAKAEYERRLRESEQQAKLEELRKKLQDAEEKIEQIKIRNAKNPQTSSRKTNLNITQEEPNNQAEIEELKRKIKEAEARARAAAEKADKILKGQGQISPKKPYLEPRAVQPEEKIGAIPPPPRRPLYNRVDPNDEKWNEVKMKYFEEQRKKGEAYVKDLDDEMEAISKLKPEDRPKAIEKFLDRESK
jgi:hypothetical protein